MLKVVEWYIFTKNGGMRPGIAGEITLMVDMENVNTFIKTFDGFDVYVNGKMLYSPNSKAEEMLAIMVEKRGSNVFPSQVAYLLCENIEERTAKNNLRVVYYRLRMNLTEHRIRQILIKKRGSYTVDAELFICDLYEFIKGNSGYITFFSGSYMPEYAWAEDTSSHLRNLHRKYNGGLI